MQLLFLDVLLFYCIDIQRYRYGAEPGSYWTLFSVLTVLALLNNLHGHFILHTGKLWNASIYFFCRLIIELAEIYIVITIFADDSLVWQNLEISD